MTLGCHHLPARFRLTAEVPANVGRFSPRNWSAVALNASSPQDVYWNVRSDAEPGRAFEDFVQARSASLFGTAMLLTGQDRAEAEDLLQLCLERSYRHWDRLSGRDEGPEPYARRILINAANDRWRRLRRRPERGAPA
jgi:hypothetical protein